MSSDRPVRLAESVVFGCTLDEFDSGIYQNQAAYALRTCEYCGTSWQRTDGNCDNCGAPLTPRPPKRRWYGS